MSAFAITNDVALILPSYGGNLLHTSPDLYSEVQKSFRGQYFTQVDLIDVCRRNYKVNFPPYSILSPIRLIGVNDGTVIIPSGLQLDNVGGRITISNSEYIKFIDEHQVDIIIAFGDNISLHSSRSKVRKASDRCSKWLEEMHQHIQRRPFFLFGVAIFCELNSDLEIENEIKRLVVANKCDGIVIGGAYVDDETEDTLLGIIKKVKILLNQDTYNGKSIPVLVQGPKSLSSVFNCIKAGANLVATSLPKILSDNKEALIYNDFIISDSDKNNEAHSNKRSHDEVDDRYVDFNIDERTISTINLSEEVYRKDLNPLLTGCACHACRNHTRAYIYHLINAKEMLAEILLYTHNQFHLLRLIEAYTLSKNRSKPKRQK